MLGVHPPSLPVSIPLCCGRCRCRCVAWLLLRPPPSPASPKPASAPPGPAARSGLPPAAPHVAASGPASQFAAWPGCAPAMRNVVAASDAAGIRTASTPVGEYTDVCQDREYAGVRVRTIRGFGPLRGPAGRGWHRPDRERRWPSTAVWRSLGRCPVRPASALKPVRRVRPYRFYHTAAGLIHGLHVSASTQQTCVASLRVPKPRIRGPGIIRRAWKKTRPDRRVRRLLLSPPESTGDGQQEHAGSLYVR